MKFWAACLTGVYYHWGTGKPKKLSNSGVLKVKGDWGIFSSLKKFEQCAKGGSWEKMKVSCFTETRYHIDFLPLVYSEGLTWRHTIGRISFVKDPHYSLTFGRIPSLVCVVFCLDWGQDYVWRITLLLSKIDWSRVKMTVWEHNWGCVSGSILAMFTTKGDQCLFKIFCPLIKVSFFKKKGVMFTFISWIEFYCLTERRAI